MRYIDLDGAARKSMRQTERQQAIADRESPFDPTMTKADIVGEGLRVAGALSLVLATKRALSERPNLPVQFTALAMTASFAAADYILATGGLDSKVQETRRTPQLPQQPVPLQAQALSARQV